MTIFNVADYLTDRKRFNFQEHEVEGVGFNLIMLSDDMIQEFKVNNEPYDDMLTYAAKNGVSIGRVRVCDDKEMSEDLNDMWDLEQFLECTPSLIHQVGLKVCEISGLTEFVEDQKKLEEEIAKEEAENVVDGDSPIREVTLGELHQNKAVA